MNLSFIRKNNSIGRIATLIIIFLVLFKPSALQAQPDPNFILDHLDLIINVNNIATRGEIELRGLIANFSYPIMSTISVVDTAGDIVIGLADTLRWLKPNDTAENGLPITQIWQPVLEYHEENHSFPSDPNIYNQLPEPWFTEVRWTEPVPTSTMLVMDVSTSMTEEIDDAKAGACLYVELMRPVDRGGVVQFSGTVDVFQAMTSDTALVKQIINSATLKAGTAVYDGIMRAISEIKSEVGRRAVIVYTDGQDNSSNITPEAVIDSARAYNLPIYTIALGNETDDLVLQQIADSTNGIFFKAATAEEMEIIFGKLSVLMQNYYVMAHASPDPFFNHTWRLVDVTVNLPNLEGRGIGRYFVGGPPANLNTDLAANITSITDTAIVIAGDLINAVKPGENYEYLLTVKNLGPNLADTVRVIHVLPDSVQFLNTSISPDNEVGDSLEWEFTGIVPQREINISVNVQLNNNVPRSLTDLISEVKVFAINDTNSVNNSDLDTVKVLFPELPENYDLSLTQQVFTDTSIDLAGNLEKAVIEGDSYRYVLTLKNLGPSTAYDFTLWDVFPDSVTPANFSITPMRQTPDSLFWQFDSLVVGDSINIAFDAFVADSLQFTPFPLINVSEVIAQNDTNADNNSSSTTVYGIEKLGKISWTDVALKLISLTDTSVVVNQKSYNAVKPDEQFQYLISLKNNGPNPGNALQLFHQLPDSVQFLDATLPAQILNQDSLFWEFSSIQPGAEQNIAVSVRLASNVPKELDELISNAAITAANDTTEDNNFASDTVKVLFPESPISLNYNLANRQQAFADTSIVIAGETVPAVWRGDNYRYDLIVINYGPATARDFTIWDAIPDSITVFDASLSPIDQTKDSLFWKFDSLSQGDSIIIALDVSVTESLPFTPFPLLNETGLIAEYDTSETDNYSSSLIYAIARPDDPHTFNTDISVRQSVVTDSFAIVGNDTLRFARTSETYLYKISVTNVSSVSAQDVKVVNILPDSITANNYQPLPEMINDDSLVWQLGILLPQTSVELLFDATVASNMPIGKNYLINEVKASASNEDPTRLSNNNSTSTVINLVKPGWDWQPYIEAMPQLVKVGNPITIRVQVTAPIDSWDLWVYLANSQIDSTYGDNFIDSNLLMPDVWTTVDPAYSESKLYTEAKKEEIAFELRARDVFGELKTANATVTIESDDDLIVDRNVFIPDKENELPIKFKLSSDRQVRLEIYDITGTKITNVAEGQFKAGWNTYAWNGLTDNGQKIGSGFYILTIHSGEYQAWKKLMIVR